MTTNKIYAIKPGSGEFEIDDSTSIIPYLYLRDTHLIDNTYGVDHMIRFESEESVERYKNFLSQWQEVIGCYFLEHKQGIIQARKHYTWVDSRDSLEVKIQRALVENHGGVTVDVFEDVEYWGFGVKTISRHNDQGAVLLATKIAFSYLRSGKLREAAAEQETILAKRQEAVSPQWLRLLSPVW